jgi:hypothetical protein
MGGIPDIMFVIDTNKEAIAIQEARKLNIPVIATLDTNCDPDGITYPIPANDDAARAIALYCDLVADTVLDGLAAGQSASGVDLGASEAPLGRAGAARRLCRQPGLRRQCGGGERGGGRTGRRRDRGARRGSGRGRSPAIELNFRRLRPAPNPQENTHGGDHGRPGEGSARALGRRHDGLQEGAC